MVSSQGAAKQTSPNNTQPNVDFLMEKGKGKHEMAALHVLLILLFCCSELGLDGYGLGHGVDGEGDMDG